MANSIVNQDTLTAKLNQICALLAQATGAGAEAFEGLPGFARENYLVVCLGIVDDCLDLATGE